MIIGNRLFLLFIICSISSDFLSQSEFNKKVRDEDKNYKFKINISRKDVFPDWKIIIILRSFSISRMLLSMSQ